MYASICWLTFFFFSIRIFFLKKYWIPCSHLSTFDALFGRPTKLG